MITGIARTAAVVAAAVVLAGLNLAGASGAAASATAPAAGPEADPATAYVANFLANTVTPINTATNMPGKAIKVGAAPSTIAITPSGKTAYVANSLSNTVTPIHTATNTTASRSRLAPTRA
jgi:YVTN family beta-propeller protein